MDRVDDAAAAQPRGNTKLLMRFRSGSEDEISADDRLDMVPHSKPNMPDRVGRMVERATYIDVAALAILVIGFSSLYFHFAAARHGLNIEHVSIFKAAYFSVVTFTTLGYGDVSPVGFGRVVAMIVVTSGLVLSALLIGKVASERQSALLTLLHTSDCQRRISAFARELAQVRDQIATNGGSANEPELRKLTRAAYTLVVSLQKYLSFNAHQAGIAYSGNESALASLYDEMWQTFTVCMKRFLNSTADREPTVMSKCFGITVVLHSTITMMSRFHNNPKSSGFLAGQIFQSLITRKGKGRPERNKAVKANSMRLQANMDRELREARVWRRTAFNPLQVRRMLAVFPIGPKSEWAPGLHKEIAKNLSISNSVASKCINRLIELGHIPKA